MVFLTPKHFPKNRFTAQNIYLIETIFHFADFEKPALFSCVNLYCKQKRYKAKRRFAQKYTNFAVQQDFFSA
jgi:hypothetical protein